MDDTGRRLREPGLEDGHAQSAHRPGGHHGGRCGGRRGALTEPVILAALMRRDGHGYDLKRAIEDMTEGQVTVDVGGLYRTLRRLEVDGFVISAWAEGDSGPQRRDYTITAEGRELADEWAAHLRERSQLTALVAGLLEGTA
jgi:DNA-binding PadR family transcriptional regulator